MTAEQLAQRMGGPTAVISVGPAPYPPADPADKAKISGEGWRRMILKRKAALGF